MPTAKPDPVIVRAFGGEPLKRVAYKKGQRLIYVSRQDLYEKILDGEKMPIGFPTDDVFEFDPMLFKGLRYAFIHKTRDLTGLWAKCKRYNP
jgi:hypothetical protein